MVQQAVTTTTTAGDKQRRLYKMLRGSYSRREGFDQPFIDPETQKPTKRRSKPFVHYAARTQRNPDAKDEVYLTDAEARAFGRQNLREIIARDARQQDVEEGVIEEMLERELPDDLHQKISMLIEEGQLIKKNSLLKLWRKRVFEAQIFTTELPTKRLDILDLLNQAG